jgi:hypothetical protein
VKFRLWLDRRELVSSAFCGFRPYTVVCLVGVIVLSSCATPYQKAGFRGGYTNFETQPGVYYVSFKGNGYTSKETVIQYWHRRVAEICGGCDRYEIIGQDASTTQHLTGDQDQIVTFHKSRAEGYIRCKEY